MNKRKKNQIGCIGLFFTVILMIASEIWNFDFGKNKIEKSEIRDKIVNIYRDKYNHMAIVFKTNNGEKIFPQRWFDAEDYANIGDSIIKEAGSLIITIKKDNGEMKTFNHR